MAIEKGNLPKLLGEVIFRKNGSFIILKQYFSGYHPGLGTYHNGWSGVETVRFKQVIKPVVIYKVDPAKFP